MRENLLKKQPTWGLRRAQGTGQKSASSSLCRSDVSTTGYYSQITPDYFPTSAICHSVNGAFY